MNATTNSRRHAALTAALGAALFLAACAPTPEVPAGVTEARAELLRLQSDPDLGALAQAELAEAEAALQLAEQEGIEPEVAAHRIYVAQRKIAIARAVAEARHAEVERSALVARRDEARLRARTLEAQAARSEANVARMEADTARMAATQAQQRAAALESEIIAMHARETERGLLLTLGDVLFETGKANLKPGTIADLDQLAAFLARYPDRTVTIEGHTDDVGTDAYNLMLSQQRADAVKSYLLRQGVDASRIVTQGMGESAPVVANDSAGHRQQNRRVEIIVSNPPAG
jgi:outer membrane protein OmpA-like peptidoglycan-associated protein